MVSETARDIWTWSSIQGHCRYWQAFKGTMLLAFREVVIFYPRPLFLGAKRRVWLHPELLTGFLAIGSWCPHASSAITWKATHLLELQVGTPQAHPSGNQAPRYEQLQAVKLIKNSGIYLPFPTCVVLGCQAFPGGSFSSITGWLRDNPCTIQSLYFKYRIQRFFKIYSQSCGKITIINREHFHHSKWNPVPIHSPFLTPQA